jgi:hypothetical protein
MSREKDSKWEDQEAALFGPGYKRTLEDRKKVTSAKSTELASRMKSEAKALWSKKQQLVDRYKNPKFSADVHKPKKQNVPTTHDTTTVNNNNSNGSNQAYRNSNTVRHVDNHGATSFDDSRRNNSNSNSSNDNNNIRNAASRGIGNIRNFASKHVIPLATQNGLCCVICQSLLVVGAYKYNPFFPNERICVSHRDPKTCTACHRFEPRNSPFVHNGGVCPTCYNFGGGIIRSSVDAEPAWRDVIDFFQECQLLSTNQMRTKLQRIPILIVHPDGLQDSSLLGTRHSGTYVRGMCMFTYTAGGAFQQWLRQHNNAQQRDASSSSNSSSSWTSLVNSVTKNVLSVSSPRIQAILCLENLPRDLTTSILIHEATHAWFKYQHILTNLSNQIEEGCCQLMAYLWLKKRSLSSSVRTNKDHLRTIQYFMYSIESDPSQIYGDGYRMVAAAYARMQPKRISTLLQYIVQNLSLPP